jgi:polysaccharide export outer membrane protein
MTILSSFSAKSRYLAIFGFALLLSACGGKPPLGGDPALSVVNSTGLPAPGREEISASGRQFYISPFDRLSINVFRIAELSREEIRVDGAGMISMPLVGAVKAAGLTPGELAEVLENGLRGKAVKDPAVSVNIAEISGQLVTVEGEVGEPGLYPVVNQMTLMRAVASAKGTTEFSDLDDVVIFRTVSGQRFAALYNLGAIRRGNYPDPKIFANDVVVVGDSPSRRLFKDLLTITPLLTTPLVVALRN